MQDKPIRAPSRLNATSAVGYNLDYPGDWTGLPPFIDLMKNSRPWTGFCAPAAPNCHPTSNLQMDTAGWVRSLSFGDDSGDSYSHVETVILTNVGQPEWTEPLVVRYRGEGVVDLVGATVLGPLSSHKASSEAVSTVRIQAHDGPVFLRILQTDPLGTGNYIRDIEVFRESHEPLISSGRLFNPEMLNYLRPFGSLRFMDWMESNQPGLCRKGPKDGEECDSGQCPLGRCAFPGSWRERPLPDRRSALARSQWLDPARPRLGRRLGGYPVEYLVALANEAGATPHFNVPARYEDEFVLRFAQYVKQHLAPELRMTVEYSNEGWNWQFPQADYLNKEGRALWPHEGSAWVQFGAARTQHLCELWKSQFPDDLERVRCLISPQTGWPSLAETMLDCPAWTALHPELGPCHNTADAINIAGYFSGCIQKPSNQKRVRGWLKQGMAYALDRVFEQLEFGNLLSCPDDESSSSLADTLRSYETFAAFAVARELELYIYESGTHFDYDGDDVQIGRLLVQATQDTRMERLYTKNFLGFKERGGTVVNAWGWIAPDDMWANSNHSLDVQHPKYRALKHFAADVPCWWANCAR